ncbi:MULTISPECIES: ATP-binding protein [Rhodopseudomonas]|uniref:ATP-binding protein n=1 Tax=Rhodopseudomonas TaxID=1073 RepID=UPI0006961147|nr:MULTISPECIES: ATP-binding protein [Rhodopseudomonas]MDF3809440.1 ATP-binding protein [Rhodopseudomonas sp. BAL398]WOK15486.1 ATP-binding protein [Rhodopseudomonas sp. BAL398]
MNAIRGYIAERGLAEQMFRLAVEASPNGMVMVNSNGQMVMVNSEIEHQFGYSREELIGQPVDILVPMRMRAPHASHRLAFTPSPETRRMGAGRDLFGVRKDGTEFPVEVGLNPIRAGDELLVLGVIVDISQRKHMERLKEEFVSTVSHELRTPLTSISGSLGLLVGQWSDKLPDSAARLLTIAHNNSQRLVRLINDILDVEKIESGRVVFNFVRFSLTTLLEQTIEDNRGFADSYGVRVTLDPESVDADINADPDRFAQVITNLISNAIKFSPPAGQVQLCVTANTETVRVNVRDHGPGVPESFRSRIFEKFAQADGTIAKSKGGTGLGLSIVKQIMERLGGNVGFEDADGGGTVFFVEIPPWNMVTSGEIDIDAPPSAPRILLCEVNHDVAIPIRQHMRQVGFAVDIARTFMLAASLAQATQYAAVIVDVAFRGGDAIDLIFQIRAQQRNRTTPLVGISDQPQREKDDVRSAKLNVLEWIGKPVDLPRLQTLLQNAIAAAPQRRPQILHFDDNRDARLLVSYGLRRIVDMVSVTSLEAARDALAENLIDLAIVNSVGNVGDLDLQTDLRDGEGHPIPVVIFTAGTAPPCGGQVKFSLSKTTNSVEQLCATVSEFLALLPAIRAKETTA